MKVFPGWAVAAVLVMIVAAVLVIQIAISLGSTQDDSFISYRYASNLASGNGLVYNVGERVEGYTNFLWTLLLAGVVLVGGDPVRIAPWMGGLAAAGLVALVIGAARGEPRVGRIAVPGIAAALMLVSGSAFGAEAVQGLETPLFALLVFAALVQDGREREASGRAPRRSGWLYALAALTRPEGIATFAIAAASRGISFLARERDRRPDVRGEVAWAARAIVPIAAHFLFRWCYYGDLVPNTFHAKVGISAAVVERGARYVGSFLLAYAPAVLLAAVGLFANRANEVARLCGGWIAFQLVYAACVGGDYKPTFRFFASVLAPLCLLAGEGLFAMLRPLGSLRAGAAGLVASAAAAGLLWFGSSEARRFTEWRKSVLPTHEAAGRWIGRNYPPGTLLATSNAGVIPYYSKLPTIDMLGLCDAVIARREIRDAGAGLAGHEKGDGAYVFRRRPDLVLFMMARFSPEPLPERQVGSVAFGISERELWSSPDFHGNYRWTSTSLPGFYFNYYERNDRAVSQR